MKKFKLLVWSGGYDSTALLMHLVEERELFDLLSIRLYNNEKKHRCELKARKKILKIINPGRLLRNYYNYSIDDLPSSAVRLHQAPLWISAIVHHIQTDTDEVQTGYIKGDDPLNYNRMEKAYQSMCKLASISHIPDLTYPLRAETKVDVLTNWYYNKHYDLGQKVREHIWTCENPQGTGKNIEKCGQCTPCKVEGRAIMQIEKQRVQKFLNPERSKQ